MFYKKKIFFSFFTYFFQNLKRQTFDKVVMSCFSFAFEVLVQLSKITVLTVFKMGKGTLLNGEGDFVPVLHVPLKSFARGFRIKATPVDEFIGCVCLKMILCQSRGEGDFVPEGEPQ